MLLDTHVLLWSLLDPERLAPDVATAIADGRNTVAVSAASLWEIAIKQSLGKLALPGPAEVWLPEACSRSGFDLRPVSPEAALAVRGLVWHHRDPFDRLLIAETRDGWTLVSHDRALEPYGVPILWA